MMKITKLLEQEREANKYLDSKGIRTACQKYLKLEDNNESNILYVAKPKTVIFTPVTDEQLEKARAKGGILAEIPFTDMGPELAVALIKAAEIVKTKLGAVSLSDVTPITYTDKDEIRKLITRLKKSTKESELKARAEELEVLVNGYEERLNDTERDDLQDKFQSILDCLETAQQDLENSDKDGCISQLEDALFY